MIRDIILHSPTAYREPATVAQATTDDQVVALWLHARSRPPAAGVGFTPSQMRALTTTTASTEAVSEARPAVLRVCAVKLRGFWCVLMLSFIPYISRRARAEKARPPPHSLPYKQNITPKLGWLLKRTVKSFYLLCHPAPEKRS